MHEYVPFAITLLAILAGILLNRNDVKDLRAEFRAEIGTVRGEIGSFRTEMNARLTKIQDDLNGFHRSLGQHDKAIEILEKKR
jgi:hypothetical protein